MQAKVHKTKQGVLAITAKSQIEAAKNEDLTVNFKPLLLVRGGDTNQTVGVVYRAFVNNVDRMGNPFVFCRSKRGLMETDPVWGNKVRVTPVSMESYIKDWFALGELVTSGGNEVIILTDKLPKMSTALWQQSRYVSKNAEFFTMID